MDKHKLILETQKGDKKAMEKLISDNELLIWNVVKRFYGRGTDKEDLFQLGAMGFIKAVNNFDVHRGLQLSTYAVTMMLGEIRRFLRDDGPVKVSRSIKETASKAMAAAERISKREGREALLSEISVETGVSETEISAAFAATERPDSINRPIYNNEGKETTLQDIIADGSSFDEELISSISLKEAARRLCERDRQIVMLRYGRNFTQSRVAEIMGISQVQVSRLEKKILIKMREFLA